MALQRTPRPHSLKVQTGLGHGVPVQEHAGTGRALRSLGSPLNAYLFGGSFRILRLTALCVILVLASACGANDNSKAVKAHSMIRPGMTLSEAFDVAERTQMADLLVMANPNGCPYDFQIGRQSGPPYIRIYSDPVEPNYKGGNRSYTEQGFENRQRFLEAVSARNSELTRCKTVTIFLSRYQGMGSGDSFDLTLDPTGRVGVVGPLVDQDF